MAAAVGATGSFVHDVAESDSAHALGNPGVRVLATPILAGFCDRAAAACVEEETAPMRVDIRHLAATPVGDKVAISAELVSVDDRRLVFRISGRDSRNEIVSGQVERVFV